MNTIRTRVRRSRDDPRPSVPLDEAFDRIEKIHANRLKVRGDASAKDRSTRRRQFGGPVRPDQDE